MTINFKGLRVLNTRPLHQGHELNLAIERAGGIAIHLPTIEIHPLPLCNHPPLADINQSIFTSVNAVTCYFRAQTSFFWPKTLLTTAIGTATKHMLLTYGVDNVQCPAHHDSEHLLQLQSFMQITAQTILLIKGKGGRTLIENTLKQRGANINIIDIYTRQLPNINLTELQILCQNDNIDIILITSEQSMHNLLLLLGPQAATWIYTKPCIVISQRLAKLAALQGFKDIKVYEYSNITK